MKSKVTTLLGIIMFTLPGCSLNKTGPGGDGQLPPEQMASVIQSRVRYVATFALTMDVVKPHKEDICQFTAHVGEFLDTYDNRGASFEKLHDAVMAFIRNPGYLSLVTPTPQKISNPAVRDALIILVDMAFTEAFNYAWKHYENLIEQDQTKVALIIAGAVADGLRDACGMTMSTMGTGEAPHGIFTIAGSGARGG